MADDLRRSHVKRIKSRTDPDIWGDVERIDSCTVESSAGFTYQKTIFSFDWSELEAVEDTLEPIYDGTEVPVGTRKIIWKKVSNPEDAAQFFPLAIPTSITVETGAGRTYQRMDIKLDNGPDNDRRETRIRTIYHGTDLEPTDPAYPVDPQASGSLDTAQRLVVEVIDKFLVLQGSGFEFLRTYYQLDNADKH